MQIRYAFTENEKSILQARGFHLCQLSTGTELFEAIVGSVLIQLFMDYPGGEGEPVVRHYNVSVETFNRENGGFSDVVSWEWAKTPEAARELLLDAIDKALKNSFA